MKRRSPKNEITNQHSIKPKKLDLQIPPLSIDQEIVRVKDMLLNAPERRREFHQRMLDHLILERELRIKSTKVIIKAALKGTVSMIKTYYPRIITWPKDLQYYQLRSKSRHFSEETIEEFGEYIKSICCPCKDGFVRIFEVTKIQAYLGSNNNMRSYQFVNVYFTLRNHHESEYPVPIKYSVN